ncbi:NACHT domain-containing protein [Streptomyces albidoflavus]
MDYDLTRLGTREFEHLTQALAKSVLGPGVSVFGDGKDGGREATFRGPVTYPHEGQQWDGYGVVQAKFRQRSVSATKPDVTWVKDAIRAELAGWAKKDSRRDELPDYILFATNVILSPAPSAGGIDQLKAFIRDEAQNLKIPLKGFDLWHFDEVCRYLDIHDGIRRSYAGFITPGDVLARLLDILPAASGTTEIIRTHASMELVADQWVRLGQAGAQPSSGKVSLGPVAVDLKARNSAGNEVEAAAYVIERGNSVMRPSLKTSEDPRHILLVGGPGQGKSTMGQLVCQAYRVALLTGEDGASDNTLTSQGLEVMQGLHTSLTDIGLPLPRSRRWPLRIALHDYANAILGGEPISLLRFLADQMSKRVEGVTPQELKRWLREWPWVIVLDGLDEVAAPETRELIMERISDFLSLARGMDADLFLVGTTRPQGYNGEFHTGDYERIELAELSLPDALSYAAKLTAARHNDDPEMFEQVAKRIAAAADEPATARLLRSPLQVTIMSLLVEKHARMPQNRYELFNAYYDTIYTREVDKPNVTGQLLAENRQHVDWLHQYVGVALQTRAAQSGQIDSLIPKSELHERLYRRLEEETDDWEVARRLTDKLIEAATDRLVLLVAPDDNDHVGFEVRSLQEYCAARALISGPEADIIPRLESLASHPSWRNTWLLAAAGIFTTKEHLRSELVMALDSVDAASSVNMALLPGATMALHLLDEDLARQHPSYQNLLVEHAAKLITHPRADAQEIAPILAEAATRHPGAKERLFRAARDAASSRGNRLMNACQFLLGWSEIPSPLGLLSQQLLGSTSRAMTPEERAAGRLFSAVPQWALPLPGLPHYTPLVDDLVPLTEFITTTTGRDVRSLGLRLHDVQVAREDIGGFMVPHVPADQPFTVITTGSPDLEELREALLETIQIKAEIGTHWNMALVATDLLKMLQSQEAPLPTVAGLI